VVNHGMADITVRRVDFGYFVRPAAETGTGGPAELRAARQTRDYTLPELLEGTASNR
jgi:hypothetical protein